MPWKTIQRRSMRKHLPHISNIKAFTLENNFCGAPIAALSDFALERGKMQIDGSRGKLRLHSNCWYDFDYLPDAKPAATSPDYGEGK